MRWHNLQLRPLSAWVIAAAAVVVTLGAFLPWQTSEGRMGNGLGEADAVRHWNGFSVVGESTYDLDDRLVATVGDMTVVPGVPIGGGLFAVILAAGGLGLGFSRRARWATACGLGVVLVGGYALLRINHDASAAAERFMVVSASYGLYVVIAGGMLAMAGGLSAPGRST